MCWVSSSTTAPRPLIALLFKKRSTISPRMNRAGSAFRFRSCPIISIAVCSCWPITNFIRRCRPTLLRSCRCKPLAAWQANSKARAFEFACHAASGLHLHDLKSVGRQRRMKFVIGQQLHTAIEMIGQDLKRKADPARFMRGDIVERFLKSNAIKGRGAVVEELTQHIRNALLALGLL